jgi:ribonucleoside-triphosphate reductase
MRSQDLLTDFSFDSLKIPPQLSGGKMKNSRLLSDIAFYRTYSAVKPDGYKESWGEVCDRYEQFMIECYPNLSNNIKFAVNFMRKKEVVGSMRMMQFAGPTLHKENLRAYNCSAANITTFKDIKDALYILMCGTGYGYSVKREHTEQLPVIAAGESREYLVLDSKEGWAEAVGALLENPQTVFDYSLVRPAGSNVSSGGTASGPEPLARSLEAVRGILKGAVGRKLRPAEVSDVLCHLADCVVVGGVRRSALICLFDADDQEMLTYKSGAWWENNSQRGRANVSAHMHRKGADKEEFEAIVDACFNSNAGEPGVVWTSNSSMITNPCAEIALQDGGLCNLSEINFSTVVDSFDFMKRAWAATFLGTLQAGLTKFNYVDPKWTKNAREEALLGVSMTGLANNWELAEEFIESGVFKKVAARMKDWNAETAALIGISPAARIGCIKPSGTTSTVLGTTSGIHAAHAPYYLRRIRIDRNSPVGNYLSSRLSGTEFLEDDKFVPSNIIVSVPFCMEGAIMREEEPAVRFMNRCARIYESWIKPSHRRGDNCHNVSATVTYKDNEKEYVKKWMWQNRDNYSGMSLLPLDLGTYVQAPFETISKQRYEELQARMPVIDLGEVYYGTEEKDGRQGEAACVGPNGCEIT